MSLLSAAFRCYFAGLGIGLRTMGAGQWKGGLKFFIYPVGYWRFWPHAYVWEEFRKLDKPRVFDLGSPKMMSLILAEGGAGSVTASDLNDERIFSRYKSVADLLGMRNYRAEYQDGRKLTYADNSFDFVYSISVIEHIPETGDTEALQEFRRVLKPGGVAVVEVPYRHERDQRFTHYDSKGAPVAEPIFYERFYDSAWLKERLEIDGLKLEKRIILGEHIPIDPWIATPRLPRVLRVLLLPLEPWLAFLNGWMREDDRSGHPLGAMLIYRKV